MSLLLRAAVLGGIAYYITRSLRNNASSMQRGSSSSVSGSGGYGAPVNELHPGENNLWPTSESQQPASANAGPSS